MSKTLYLHIGTQKTGTTALQRFLATNEARLAAEHDLWYPAPASVAYGSGVHSSHVILPYAAAAPRRWPAFVPPGERISADEAFGALQRDVDRAMTGRVVVSSEDFTVHGVRSRAVIDRVAALRGCDLRVVVYLRPQADVLESLYSWNPAYWKTGRALDDIAEDPTAELPAWMDYERALAPWRDRFGDDALDCRLFGLPPHRDVVQDFCAHLGIDADAIGDGTGAGGLVPVARANAARPAGVIEFFRLTLPGIAPAHQDRFVEDLRPFVEAAVDDTRLPPLGDAGRAAVAERFATGNRVVAQAFFGRDDLFEPVTRDGREPSATPLLPPGAVERILTAYWSSRPDTRPGAQPDARRARSAPVSAAVRRVARALGIER